MAARGELLAAIFYGNPGSAIGVGMKIMATEARRLQMVAMLPHAGSNGE